MLTELRHYWPDSVVYPGKDAVGVGGENLFSGTTLSTEANEPVHSGLLYRVHILHTPMMFAMFAGRWVTWKKDQT